MRLVFVKNMRYDDGLEIVIHTRTVGLKNTHIDPCRPYIALGIYWGVWEEDVYERYFKGDPSTLPKRLPHLIPVKKDFRDRPVFVTADGTKPWSVCAFRHQYAKAARANNFSRTAPYVLRHSAATNQQNSGIPKDVTQYYCGHTLASNMVNGAYVSRHRQTDLLGYLLGEDHQTQVTALRGSISWETFTSGKLTDADKTRILGTMSAIGPKALKLARVAGECKSKMVSALGEDAVEAHPDDQLVIDHMDCVSAAKALFEEAVRLFYEKKGPSSLSFPPDACPLIVDTFAGPYQALQDSVLYSGDDPDAAEMIDVACSTAFDHPFLTIARDNPAHPARSIMEHMMALMAADDIEDSGDCQFCALQGKETLKSQKNNISEHMYKCEAKLYPDMERCNVCLAFIPDIPKEPALATNDVASQTILFNEHHEACHDNLINGSLPEEEDAGKPASKLARGLEPFALASVAANVRRRKALHRIFCPICLYDDSKGWKMRHR